MLRAQHRRRRGKKIKSFYCLGHMCRLVYVLDLARRSYLGRLMYTRSCRMKLLETRIWLRERSFWCDVPSGSTFSIDTPARSPLFQILLTSFKFLLTHGKHMGDLVTSNKDLSTLLRRHLQSFSITHSSSLTSQ